MQMLVRTARRDVEIAGERIPAGAMFVLLLGGANRDPGVFADPGRFDITRPNARDHLAFGSGIHVASAPLWRESRAPSRCARYSSGSRV